MIDISTKNRIARLSMMAGLGVLLAAPITVSLSRLGNTFGLVPLFQSALSLLSGGISFV